MEKENVIYATGKRKRSVARTWLTPGNGEMKIIKTMSIALAANLMIVDDFYAAKFLRCVVDALEDPQSLTVDP